MTGPSPICRLPPARPPGVALALAVFLLGSLLKGWVVLLLVESHRGIPTFAPYLSDAAWAGLVALLGGTIEPPLVPGESPVATLPLLNHFAVILGLNVVLLLSGALVFRLRKCDVGAAVRQWMVRGWLWSMAAGAWGVLWAISLWLQWGSGLAVLSAASPLWMAVFASLCLGEAFAAERQYRTVSTTAPSDEAGQLRGWLLAGIGLSIVTFTAMNWGLWFNLQIPHGDSAMYEEHLWNLEHRKGFRSYLDQGLFLGEHIQVIHVLLVPLHLLWPSHLLLELCESIALGMTALPVYLIARRHTGSEWAALYLGLATLLYFPLQTLDISIDFKTFRPIAFGVPLLLAAIDQIERRRWKTAAVLLLLTLSAKEDYAIIISLLGLWLWIVGDRGLPALPPGLADASKPANTRRTRFIGAAICIAAAIYLLIAVKVAIPWFRGGETPHFARYFSRFGETPLDILWGMLTRPGLLAAELLDAPTLLYTLYLLVPLGLLPILSPSRLLVGLPLFVLLCLNELAQQPAGPFHHFHAPLLPIVLWAAASGLGRLISQDGTRQTAICGARFALACALLTGVCYTLTPLGLRFWDSGRIVAGRPTWWRALYIPDERAQRWKEIAPLIPRSARVASTDFVHPRLTHHERSYDYSGYLRKVAGYEARVPQDTEYIVIDLQHPYSRSVLGESVQRPEDVRELVEQPDRWELISPPDDPYFAVLKRRPDGEQLPDHSEQVP